MSRALIVSFVIMVASCSKSGGQLSDLPDSGAVANAPPPLACGGEKLCEDAYTIKIHPPAGQFAAGDYSFEVALNGQASLNCRFTISDQSNPTSVRPVCAAGLGLKIAMGSMCQAGDGGFGQCSPVPGTYEANLRVTGKYDAASIRITIGQSVLLERTLVLNYRNVRPGCTSACFQGEAEIKL